MKNSVNKRIGLLWLLLLWQDVRAETARVSLVFEAAPIVNVLQMLADQRQLDLVVAEEVKGTISLKLNAVPWQQALDLVARLGHIRLVREGNVLLASAAEREAHPDASLDEVSQRGMPADFVPPLPPEPRETYSLLFRHVSVEQVAKSLEAQRDQLLTANGVLIVDKRANRLVIHDTAASIADLRQWLPAFDTPVRQVALAAHIVTINEEHLGELGVRWGSTPVGDSAAFFRQGHFAVNTGVNSPVFTAGIHLAHIKGHYLDLELSALEREQQAEIIASPHLLTSHLQPASIKQGTEIPYEVTQGTNGATTVEFKEAVLGMEVTPDIRPDGRITLVLKISQNMPGRSLKQGSGEALAIDKQEIETQVTVSDGETVVLGGIFQKSRTQGQDSVPVLGRLPWLRGLFRHRSQQQEKRELVIFITPTLINS